MNLLTTRDVCNVFLLKVRQMQHVTENEYEKNIFFPLDSTVSYLL